MMAVAAPLRAAALAGLLGPKTVAVFGISADPAKLGNVILANVLRNGFAGRCYGIGRGGGGAAPAALAGATLVGSWDEVPEPVDVALFAVPGAAPAGSAAERAARAREGGRGHRLGLLRSGPRKAGSWSRRCAAIARPPSCPLIGPNCQGVVVPQARLQMTFSPMYDSLLPGNVAVISQSGAMGGYMANRLMQRGVGLSCFVSSGNETVLSSTDYIAALNEDPATRVILCYLEQIKDGRRFAEVARRLDPAQAPGGGEERAQHGRRRRHRQPHRRHPPATTRWWTGCSSSWASSARATAPRRWMPPPPSLRARCCAASASACCRWPAGWRWSWRICWRCAGSACPSSTPPRGAGLDTIVPAFGATRNPIDLTGAVLTQEDLFERALQVFSGAANIDGFAVISTFIRNPRYAHAIVRLFRSTDKPVVVCWTGSVQQTPESLAILADAGVPVYDNTARAANAFCALRGDAAIG